MRSDDPPVALWLLAWHGDAADGLALLTELGMGPEDARHALASTPSLLARELSPLTAREVADRLEAMGGRVELRYPKPSSAPPRIIPSASEASPSSATRRPWYRRPLPNVLAGLFLCFLLFEGLRTAGVVSGGSSQVFSGSSHLERGMREEAQNHRHDPEFERLWAGIVDGDGELQEAAERAHYRGLQYLSHTDLVRFFGMTRRILEAPDGCSRGQRSLEVLSAEEQADMGRLQARAMALGVHDRPATSGHERAIEEGLRFAVRRLPAHEQSGFQTLAERARSGDREAECTFSVALLRSSDEMHGDLQRRFLRAFAYRTAEVRGAL